MSHAVVLNILRLFVVCFFHFGLVVSLVYFPDLFLLLLFPMPATMEFVYTGEGKYGGRNMDALVGYQSRKSS